MEASQEGIESLDQYLFFVLYQDTASGKGQDVKLPLPTHRISACVDQE
jgi:hypothetical protein